MKFYGTAKLTEVSWNLVPPPRFPHLAGGPEALAWEADQGRMRRKRQWYRSFCVGYLLINAGLMYLPLQMYARIPVAGNFESLAVLLYSAALVVMLYMPNLPSRIISIGANFGLSVVMLLGIVPHLAAPMLVFEVARYGNWSWLILYPAWIGLAALSAYFAPLLIRLELTLEQAPPRASGAIAPEPGAKPDVQTPVVSKWFRFWQGLILLPLTIHFASTPYKALLEWNQAGAGKVVEVICALGIAVGFIGFMYSRSPFRLLAYGASCYFSVSNFLGSLVHLFRMPRTSDNRFIFDLLADPSGWWESAWGVLWLILMVVTVVKAVRLLQADLDEVTGSSASLRESQPITGID